MTPGAATLINPSDSYSWGKYTTDQEWDRVTYARHGWE